jgi:hypothetical protein
MKSAHFTRNQQVKATEVGIVTDSRILIREELTAGLCGERDNILFLCGSYTFHNYLVGYTFMHFSEHMSLSTIRTFFGDFDLANASALPLEPHLQFILF